MNKLQNQTLNQSLKMKTPNRHQLPKKPQQSSKVNLLYFKYIETNFFFYRNDSTARPGWGRSSPNRKWKTISAKRVSKWCRPRENYRYRVKSSLSTNIINATAVILYTNKSLLNSQKTVFHKCHLVWFGGGTLAPPRLAIVVSPPGEFSWSSIIILVNKYYEQRIMIKCWFCYYF